MTIDFNTKKFTRNTFLDGKWGVQETTGPFPYTEGDRFSLSVYVTEHGFTITSTADGESVWTHTHQTSLRDVKHFVAKGPIELEDVTLFRKNIYFT